MRAKRAVDIIAIELRDANQNEARISSYLRSRQAQGKELKSEVMTAMIAFFETYAIADDPLCSSSDLHDSWIRSLNLLSGQMSSLSACVERKIQVQPESWRRFGLVSMGQSSPLAISTGSIASSPPSPPPAAKIAQAIDPVPAAPLPEVKAKSVKEMSTEERNDYFVNMSEEERTECLNALPKDERDDYLRVLPIEERNDYLATLSTDEVRAFVKSLSNNQLTIK